MADPPKIALFGGSFDPVHNGHLQMATTARDALRLDQVRFIPCWISPHKQESSPTAVADRLQMLRLATHGLDWAVVDDFEAVRPGPSYSWQTAEAMRDQFPAARLFWIMGSDQWRALPTWTHPERLAHGVEFVVCTRRDDPEPRSGFTLHALRFSHPASATKIRRDIANGMSRHPWLPGGVADYIDQHQLYATAGQ